MSRKKVVIWAGHGGRDPGASANGIVEKNINLQLALLLEEKLKPYDCEVILGRRTDVFVPLADKAKFCDDNKSDLNIDIHCNAGRGIGFESYILTGLSLTGTTGKIARTIHDWVSPVFKANKSRDRGLKQNGFFLLRHTEAPAWLPEYGFLDDPSLVDPNNLKRNSFVNEIMEATAVGAVSALGIKKLPVTKPPKPEPKPPKPPGNVEIVKPMPVRVFLNGEEYKDPVIDGQLIRDADDNLRTYIPVIYFEKLPQGCYFNVEGMGDWVKLDIKCPVKDVPYVVKVLRQIVGLE